MIQDATACCAQEMEFTWEDGSHIYPDEYPKDNAEIVVEGKMGIKIYIVGCLMQH